MYKTKMYFLYMLFKKKGRFYVMANDFFIYILFITHSKLKWIFLGAFFLFVRGIYSILKNKKRDYQFFSKVCCFKT